MGKGSKPTIGYKYWMGLHIGICHGPINQFIRILAGDRTAWAGNVTSSDEISINAPDIFGGDRVEGGLYGAADLMFGEADQGPNDYLQVNEGIQQPAYRGLMTLVYRGGEVCSLNPYLKPWSFQVARNTAGWSTPVWYAEKAIIVVQVEADVYDDSDFTTNSGGWSNDPTSIYFNPNNPDTSIYNFAQAAAVNCQNPAHIVYECMTNASWGLGYPVADLDDASFRAAADQLYLEGFGLCITWTQQDQIDNFVQSICDHIGACFVVNPQTGLFQLKLIRGGYDVSTLIVLDTSNIKTLDFTRASPLNMVNEVQVGYVNANTGKQHKTPPAQNNANIANAGGIIAQAKDYPGIPCGALGSRVALRDLNSQGTALASVKLSVNRSAAATMTPGDVFVLNWAPLALTGIVFRVGEMDYGKLDDGTITVTAVEDVFGLPDGSYANVQQSQWLAFDPTPAPVTTNQPIEASYRDMAFTLGSVALAQLPPTAAYAGMLALKPGGISFNYDLWTNENGQPYTLADQGADFTPYGVLSAPLIPAYVSTFQVTSATDLDQVEMGSGCQIGTERCIVTNITPLTTVVGSLASISVSRGTDDSVPHSWPTGTPVWFYDNFEGGDTAEYTQGETWYAKLLTRTSAGLLGINAAPQVALPLVGRAQMPLPPGQLTINGAVYPASFSGDVTLGWASRNRLTQLDVLVPTGTGSIAPEVGTTYNIGLYAEDGTFIRTVNTAALTYDYTAAQQVIDQSNVSLSPIWSRDFIANNLNDVRALVDPLLTYPMEWFSPDIVQVGGGNTYDSILQLLSAPALADFEIELDVLLENINQAGIVFRQTYWPAAGHASKNTWAYAAFVGLVDQTYGSLFSGPNAATGAFNLLGQGTTVAAGVWTKLRVRCVGQVLQMWFNDVLQVKVTDARHDIAGGFGLYAATALSGAGYAQFRNIRLRKATQRPLGSFKFTLGSARGGFNSYDSHNVTVTSHGWGLAWGVSWGN